MPASVTTNFRLINARQFVDSFEEYDNGGRDTVVGKSYVYLFIGKILPWEDTHAGYSDSVVPSPDNDVQGIEFEPWRDMIALERIVANTDISFGAKRYNWSSGTVYSQYDDQDPSIKNGTAAFYVYTDAGNVFKCLDNNLGSQSSVSPTKPTAGLLTEPFVTSDGYRWKYMGSIPNATAVKFLTTNYMPVRTLNAFSEFSPSEPDGFEDLAQIQENANNGTIETYVVFNGGSGYQAHSGGISDANRVLDTDNIANSTFIILGSGSQSSDDYYNGASIYLANSTYEKGVATIEDFGTLIEAGGTSRARACLLNPGFPDSLAPYTSESSVTYHIGPRIDVIGDGQDANAYSICTSSGSVSQIKTWKAGNNYTTANVVIIQPDDNAGTGAQARAIISPPGGHGYDQVSELNGYNIIVSKTLTGFGSDNSETGTGNNFPTSNQYRTVGLLRNAYLKTDYAGPGSDEATIVHTPATSGKNWYANSTPLHQSTWIVANTTEGGSGPPYTWTPSQDDEIIGNTSGATGRVIEYNSDGRQIINITNVTANTSGGGFMATEQIGRVRDSGGTKYQPTQTYVSANGVQHDGTSTVIYNPDLQEYTGEILYVENRTPITRSTDQAEDIKIVIEF